jgi:hypothetical protein
VSSARVTETGLAALQQAIKRLPAAVTEALKTEAHRSATRVATHAKGLLRSQTHGSGRTADAIEVIEDSDHQQFTVNSPAAPGDPPNLPLWLELGTIYMAARPYMRPAAAAEDAPYKAHMTAAAEGAAQKVLD